MASVLVPNLTCWKAVDCTRLGFLIDAQEYYTTLYKAFALARERITILCWDINSQTELLHARKPRQEPTQLGPYLQWLCERRPELQVYILDWSFPLLYGLDREKHSKKKFEWGHSANIHFRLDDQLPMGASHHEKIILIDDEVVFLGGMDITESRWDTTEHLPSDPRRINLWGTDYPATHDVQVMLQGNVAHTFASLARERWRRATNEVLDPCAPREPGDFDALHWESGPAAMGIVRTAPRFKKYPNITETQAMITRMIETAEQYVYIEQQYFTSKLIAEAIIASLRKKKGPEIIIVQPLELRDGRANKWLDILRLTRLLRMKAADRSGRLHLLHAAQQGLEGGVYVHSKLMITDDRYAFVTSANFSDRSMGFDTESGVTIDAASSKDKRNPVAHLLYRLLAEHCGATVAQIDYALARCSIVEYIERQEMRGRYLAPFPLRPLQTSERVLRLLKYVDPIEPLSYDILFDSIEAGVLERPTRKRIVGIMAVTTVIGVFMALLITVGVLERNALTEFLIDLQTARLQALWVISTIALGITTFVPYSLLTISTATLFPGFKALLYILSGALLGTTITYGIGSMLGMTVLRGFFSKRIERLGREIGDGGFMTLLLVRLVPIAPFALVNMVAGALGVPLHLLLLSTFVGLFPGALILVVFQRSLILMLLEGDPRGAIGFLGVILVTLGILYFLKKRMRHFLNRMPSLSLAKLREG